jgi:6-pyruvoyltetrahydropterin/6-carboxytetrahydropterin synthase
MYMISKRLSFSASHMIGGLPDCHPCARLHGHNYDTEVELEAEHLDDVGFVRDYHELAVLKSFLDETVDNKHLNDVLGHDRTTAEVIANGCSTGAARSGRKSHGRASRKRRRPGPYIADERDPHQRDLRADHPG